MSRVRPAGSHARSGLLKGPYTPRSPKWCPWLIIRTGLHSVLLAMIVLLLVAGAWIQLLALTVMLAFGALGVIGFRTLAPAGDVEDAAPLVAPEPGEWAA